MSTITRRRGDTYADEWIITDASTGQPVNLTGYTGLWLTVDSRAEPTDDSTRVYQLSGAIVGDPTAGRIAFAPSLSQANQVGKLFYDVQVTDAAGKIRTIDSGTYLYLQDVTKV